MTDVTCAIIVRQGMALVVRRAEGMHLAGYWEFPGGKLRQGESPRDCIVREIQEELSLEVSPVAALEPVEHEYPDKSIRLIPFVCALEGGELELREHTEARWLWPEDLLSLELCPADMPVARSYLEHALSK